VQQRLAEPPAERHLLNPAPVVRQARAGGEDGLAREILQRDKEIERLRDLVRRGEEEHARALGDVAASLKVGEGGAQPGDLISNLENRLSWALGAPPPPSRTNWTRLVPPPVLTGHTQRTALVGAGCARPGPPAPCRAARDARARGAQATARHTWSASGCARR